MTLLLGGVEKHSRKKKRKRILLKNAIHCMPESDKIFIYRRLNFFFFPSLMYLQWGTLTTDNHSLSLSPSFSFILSVSVCYEASLIPCYCVPLL